MILFCETWLLSPADVWKTGVMTRVVIERASDDLHGPDLQIPLMLERRYFFRNQFANFLWSHDVCPIANYSLQIVKARVTLSSHKKLSTELRARMIDFICREGVVKPIALPTRTDMLPIGQQSIPILSNSMRMGV